MLIAAALASALACATDTTPAELRALEERLVRDANALLDAPRVRPVHRGEPAPGSLGETLAAHLPPFEADPRTGCADGAALDRHLDALLAGTLRGRAELAPSADPFNPAPGVTWIGFQRAVTRARDRVDDQRAAAQHGPALQTCVDALGLGRDAAIAGGLVGAMVASASTKKLFVSCAFAVDGAPHASLVDALESLRKIRSALPDGADLLRLEAVSMELLSIAPCPGVVGRLGPNARAWMTERCATQQDPAEVARRVSAWSQWRSAFDELIAAAAQPPVARERTMVTVRERAQAAAPTPDAVPADYRTYLRRADATRIGLDLLTLAADARQFRSVRGRWPETGAELAAPLPPTAPERASTNTLRLTPNGGRLLLSLSLPVVDGEDEDVALVVRAGVGR